jgi:membrane-associated protein
MKLFDIIPLIQTIGLLGIFFFAFAESGVFLGAFLPGDSLLFTAGVLAAAGYFNVWQLFFGCFMAAILGDAFGYWFGAKAGPKIFSHPKSLFWNERNLERTALFFKKYGNKTITLARFTPIVRTFAPILAGAGKMEYKVFFFWNVLGGFLWSGLLIFTGYFLGNSVQNIDRIIVPIILVIIFISLVPLFWHLVQARKKAGKAHPTGEENG